MIKAKGLLKQLHRQFTQTRRYAEYLRFSKPVADALKTHQPIVALESTIITHGMPYPENLETALAVENIVKQNDAVPATIAVLDGEVHIGLSEKELINLAKRKQPTMKVSRRDLPAVLSEGLNGGTTVSGTMLAAHKAGLPIFVTGGIGGVHRGYENTMDVSADLTELGRTPVAVVSAGVKSILDIEKTLEYLETQGVCVATYGETLDFPAFFTNNSGCQAPYNVTSPRQAARLVDSMVRFELGSGLLIAVPVVEADTVDMTVLQRAVDTAIAEANDARISGRDITPYVLRRVNEITQGQSLKANIALIQNNAKVGAEIACELEEIRFQTYTSGQGRSHIAPHMLIKPRIHSNQPIVVGGTNIDLTCSFDVADVEANGGTYPGRVQQSFGGVGRNIADCLTRLGTEPLFVSAVGGDTHAENLLHSCKHMNLSAVKRCADHSTAVYSAVLQDTGDVMFGVGDFTVHNEITPEYVGRFEENLVSAPLVIMDGNIPAETIRYICDVCHANQVPVWFEPTDIRLIDKLFESDAWQKLTYASPNMNELQALSERICEVDPEVAQEIQDIEYTHSDDENLREVIEMCARAVQPVLHVIPNVMVTIGRYGVLMCRSSTTDTPFQIAGSDIHKDSLSIVHYPVRKAGQGLASIKSVSGAGDCLVGSMLWRIMQHRAPAECIVTGLLASQKSLRDFRAVPNTISPDNLSKEQVQQWREKYCTPAIIV